MIEKSVHIEVWGCQKATHGWTYILLIRAACFMAFLMWLYICFGLRGRGCIWESKWNSCGSDTQGKSRCHCICDFETHSHIIENLSFLNCIADQDKNYNQVWYYLRVQVLLVSCLMVKISSLLCLLDVLHFIPSVSRKKFIWGLSRIAVSTVRCHCRHCRPPLDFHEANLISDYVGTVDHGGIRLSPSSYHTCQYIRRTHVCKHYCTTDWAMLCGMEWAGFWTHKSNYWD